jgi:hypothetical protein
MFYSGISTREDGRVQRVGLATSEDLLTWERQPLVVEADPRWYEKAAGHSRREEAWRDPWVFRDPGDGRFHMVVCARVNHGLADERGVLGHASSADLGTWEAGPPLSAPGEFSQLEVPQLLQVGGAWRAMARMHMAQTGYPLSIVHHYALTREEARDLSGVLMAATRRTLERMPGASSKRLADLPFAALVLRRLLRASGARRVIFSANGLREGWYARLIDAAERKRDVPCVAVVAGVDAVGGGGSVGTGRSFSIGPAGAAGW